MTESTFIVGIYEFTLEQTPGPQLCKGDPVYNRYVNEVIDIRVYN